MATEMRERIIVEDGMSFLAGMMLGEYQDTEKCLWCGQWVTDGSQESGWTGLRPDWCYEGDYGCDSSPISGYDGTGGHFTKRDAIHLYVIAQAQL